MKIYYLFEFEPDQTVIQAIKELGKVLIKREFKKHFVEFEEDSLLIVDAKDSSLATWLYKMRSKRVTILLLPNALNPLAQKNFAIPKEPLQALHLLKDSHPFKHIITVNDEALLDRLIIGDASWLTSRPTLSMVKNLFELKLFFVTIEADQTVETAALLIEGGDEPVMHSIHPQIFENSRNICERATILIYAPQSILQTLKMRTHPKASFIKSKNITITSPSQLTILFNNSSITTQRVHIRRLPTQYTILTGWRECHTEEIKESARIDSLPTKEMAQFYAKRSLPLFPVAQEEDFAKLFTKIRSNAKLNATYLFLFIVSVLMATFGLFQDSAPTIIGAMILAPLMGPVIATSVGIIRFDGQIIKNSLTTIALSLLLALAIAALLAKLFPFTHITQQMSIRTHPTLLDLGVALLSGLAAAYGYVNQKVGESLAGVAIAVALVPPLCVAGIGLGWENFSMFYNALLLVLANIIGIIFAAGVMFYILGFASKRYVSAALFIKVLLLFSITIPLFITTKSLIQQELIYNTLQRTLKNFEIQKIESKNGKLYVYLLIDVHESHKLQTIANENTVFITIPMNKISH